MNPDNAVDWTIRNQRYSSWPWTTNLVLVAASWLGLGAWINLLNPAPAFALGVAIVLLFGSGIGCGRAVTRQPIRRLKLGESLDAWPRGKNSIADVRQIYFGPDPAEDYDESLLPILLCEATITVRRGPPVRLIVSAGDAARMQAWALARGVPVADPHGYANGTRPIADGGPGGYPTG